MKKIASIALVVITCSFTFLPKETQLHYVFKKGDAYEIVTVSSTTQHYTVAGTDQNVTQTLNSVLQMKIVDVLGTSAKFEVEYSKISSKADSPMGANVMDSEGDTTNAMNKALWSMKGKKFNFIMKKNGTVESVENIDNLWSKVGAMKAAMEQSFGKNFFVRSIENVFAFYPEEKLKPGSTWKNPSTLGTALPLQVQNNWTLESVNEPNVVLVNDGAITTTDSTKVVSLQGGVKSLVNMKGRQVIKITASVAHGWPETSKSYYEVKGKMMLQPGGQIPEEMEMQMEIKGEAEYMVKKK
ncbi:hypothetical protein WSM22_17080 [Cytophagales bacterium WSM2-2]|nr:hypothetical protein WSM22_17080 [Cytophagales bacterium WSM2-2]